MKHDGSGWVIVAEHADGTGCEVVSILPARRGKPFVGQFMQQSYADRFGSIDERLEFKRRPGLPRFALNEDSATGLMRVGNGPVYVAFLARCLAVTDDGLSFDQCLSKPTPGAPKPGIAVIRRTLPLPRARAR